MSKRLDDTKVVFDFDDMALYSQEDIGLFCLSDWDSSIILSCLRFAQWPSRWQGGNGRLLRDDGRESDLEIALTDVEGLIARLMTDSCNDLTAAINNLATITSGGGGCGCGVAGAPGTDPPLSIEGHDPIEGPLTVPPAGYPGTIEEYRVYKCNVAETIVSDLLQDVQWYASQDLIAMTTAFLLVALVTPIVGDEVVAVLTVLLAISGAGEEMIEDLENAINAVHSDMVCALYVALDATQAQADAIQILEAQIDIETSDPVARLLLKQLVGWHLNNYSVNRLFIEDTAGIYEVGDCSGCATPQWWECLTGTVLNFDENTVDIESVLGASGNQIISVGNTTPFNTISWTAIAGSHTQPTDWSHQMWDYTELLCGTGNTGQWDEERNNFLPGPYNNVTTHQIRSSTPVTVRYTKT